jgi:hypothetical protein
MRNRVLLTTLLCLCCVVVSNAQRKAYVRIKEKPLVRFEWECAKPSLYPKAKLNRLVRPLLRDYRGLPGVWGDRAFAYDLNGDNVKEYFVPLDCGATGNCNWGIFAVNPSRLLGTVSGESIYVHQRVGQWSQLSVAIHGNVSVTLIATYHFRKGEYREFGKPYEASVYREDFPRLLLTVEPLCNPDYVPSSRQP